MEYVKDFDGWNEHKKQLEQKNPPMFKTREVWWCSLGENVGFEESGKNAIFERPVLIIRKFNKELFVGVPLTTIAKENKFYYKLPQSVSSRQGYAILSQTKIISSRRLNRKLYQIGKGTVSDICARYHELLIESLELNRSPERTRGSRVASASLYDQYSKPEAKSQVANRNDSTSAKGEKSDSAGAESSEPEGYSTSIVSNLEAKVKREGDENE
jgi:mRNA interferase MazF